MSGALELRQISRRFGDVVALNEAVLAVRPGTVHAVLGENGAGKTTLMRIAYGMLAPDAGAVVVHGNRQHFRSPADAIVAGIGMVQQHPSNVAAMTVWENVVLGGKGSLRPRVARREVQALVEQLHFSLDADARVANLSVAAQQKLEILKAAFRQARILILDEPTAILAPEEAAELYVWLRKFAADGGTAIVVTHKLTEAREHTDDLTVLRSGRTVLQAASASLSVADLTHALIGEAIATPAPSRPASAGPAVVRLEGLLLRDERQVTVLRDASFEIRAGEILGIAGVEGSGHHHLLLALAGRHPSSGGRIQLAARTSIIPEDRHRNAVALPFTLAENVAIRNAGARRGALSWSRLRAQAAAFIEQFDVRAPGPNATMQTLSGGNQQKFVLAREFADQPQLIIAENPTRGLDIRASAFVREQLRNARSDGVAVALYSSDLDEILDLADRVIVIHSGRVVQVGMDRSEIGAAMLGAA